MVIVTGGSGFLGSHLVSQLGDRKIFVPRSNKYDLRYEADAKRMFSDAGKVDIVFHLAATVGGIGANRLHPGKFFYDNMLMSINIIHQASIANVKKLVFVGTTCSYPKFVHIPFNEFSLFDGFPEETNAPYGIAKRAALVMLQAYRAEYGLNFNYIIPTNLYGPGDNFDDGSSHVIPALIKKCLRAKAQGDKSIVVWGTGTASRDFVYVEDAAKALILAMERYERSEPLNLGSGDEVKISTLIYLIKKATGYNGAIEYDTSKPDGQPRRCLNTRETKKAIDWTATTDLKEGLQKTVGS
jgi:nucleoside-diphosphate-sugar epimerase